MLKFQLYFQLYYSYLGAFLLFSMSKSFFQGPTPEELLQLIDECELCSAAASINSTPSATPHSSALNLLDNDSHYQLKPHSSSSSPAVTTGSSGSSCYHSQRVSADASLNSGRDGVAASGSGNNDDLTHRQASAFLALVTPTNRPQRKSYNQK